MPVPRQVKRKRLEKIFRQKGLTPAKVIALKKVLREGRWPRKSRKFWLSGSEDSDPLRLGGYYPEYAEIPLPMQLKIEKDGLTKTQRWLSRETNPENIKLAKRQLDVQNQTLHRISRQLVDEHKEKLERTRSAKKPHLP